MPNALSRSINHLELKFCNRRQWREFLVSMPNAETYPRMLAALRASAARLRDEVLESPVAFSKPV